MNAIAQLPEPDLDIDIDLLPIVIRTVGPRCADGNGTLTPLFFSDDLVDIGRAKAISTRCPLRANCLADAIDREEPWGVWGGGAAVQRPHRHGEASVRTAAKHPRPPLVIDELGVVPVEKIA